ncbi:hypothetical protein H7683_21735 [Ectopseudomonas mendocina]|uniref:hypothetical protein n=1 Tax=Ectopseudomonas mendocina TaxID=300 RepID=UPI001ADF74C3|nr:hypothetical protein [Pseudomonas mendocina]QTN45564.1 hypothetical protein H7683_21735 [Pseudomonas mendocina]
MKSLAEIVHDSREVKQGDKISLAASTRSELVTAGVSILGGSLGTSKASQFANQTADLVISKGFLDELEGNIGVPQAGESEAEFVSRAKLAMFNLLKSKLS